MKNNRKRWKNGQNKSKFKKIKLKFRISRKEYIFFYNV